MGEYVSDPCISKGQESTLSFEESALFSVGTNAIVLNVASPAAIEDAVLTLIHNPQSSAALGLAGRRTVIERFTLEQQMRNYDTLYKSLAW